MGNPTEPEDEFFANLRPFQDSKDLLNPLYYVEAPSNWVLFLTDIRGSTKAIEQGRYKDVNTIGACSIIAAKNATDDFDFPFVFGGDGASLIVPAKFVSRVSQALSFVRKKAKVDFDLDLRIAKIPLADISQTLGKIMVAKYQISPGNHIAMFSGGGLIAAEKIMKSSPELLIPMDEPAVGSVDGLECRFNPIKAARDGILTLIVKAKSSEIIVEIMSAFAKNVIDPKPVKKGNIPISWPPKFLWQESKVKFSFAPFRILHFVFWNLVTSIFWLILMAFHKQEKGKVEKFLKNMSENSDYIKFDDHFRIILDVSFQEKEFIVQMLEELKKKKLIVYGSHFSSQALMTCFIQSRDRHIHFIDGSDGGYALAAKQMKTGTL